MSGIEEEWYHVIELEASVPPVLRIVSADGKGPLDRDYQRASPRICPALVTTHIIRELLRVTHALWRIIDGKSRVKHLGAVTGAHSMRNFAADVWRERERELRIVVTM